MTELHLKLHLLQHQSEDDFFLVRALHDRGVARVGANSQKAVQALLHSLGEQLLQSSSDDRFAEDPSNAVLHWHHHALPSAIEALPITLSLQPPTRTGANLHDTDWLSPVELPLAAYRWQVAMDQHHAVIPGLGIHVMTESADELAEQLQQHAQLWLTRKSQKQSDDRARGVSQSQQREPAYLGLKQLVALARLQFVEIDASTLSIAADTVKQREQQKSFQPKTSVLKEVADDLAALDPPAYELDTAIQQLAELLTGPLVRSVLVVGPAGSGKSTMIAALARRARQLGLADRDFWQTTGARLIAGQSGFGMWQERVQRLCRELAQSKSVLHLGNLTELMEVGRTQQGEQSIAGFLRTEIARNAILVVAECTPEQLLAIERAEPGLVAAFHLMHFQAPSAKQGRAILGLEAKRLLVSELNQEAQAALDWIARLHQRYAGYSAFPARMLRFLRTLISASLSTEATTESIKPTLKLDAVTVAFRRDSGLPAMLLDDQQVFARDEVVRFFTNRVLGQRAAIDAVVDRIAQIKAQLHRGQRPLASLLFIGPTGTGKTELAKALAEFLFASRQRLTRFDLSQVTDAGAVQRLIGSSAMGKAEGLLTAKIREQPFSVLLLDEFEKAHPSFFDLLLQMLGDGRLTDGSGRVADFSNAVILLTSNLGAKQAGRTSMGFNPGLRDQRLQFESAVQDFVRPELYNRFDAIVPFAALDQQQIHQIAKREVDRIAAREGLRTPGFVLQASDAAIAHLAELGFDAQFGARALKRVIESQLSTPIAMALTSIKPDAQRDALKTIGFALDFNAGASPMLKLSLLSIDQRQAKDQAAAINLGEPSQPSLRAQSLRRKLDALWQCDRVAALHDELTLLNMRAAKAIKRKQLPDAETSARIKALSPALQELRHLRDDSYALETTVTAEYWQQLDRHADSAATIAQRNAQHAQRLAQLELARQHTKRQLFRLSFKQADQIRFAVCSEHAAWLFELLTAYQMLCQQHSGTMQLIGVVERPANPGKASAAALKVKPFEDIKEPEVIFQAPQTPLLAVIVEVKGELFAPMFAAEFGLHGYKPAKTEGAERWALVEWAGQRSRRGGEQTHLYQPREELSRAGALASLALTRRRSFSVERSELVDTHLEPNKRRWLPQHASKAFGMVRQDITPLVHAALLRAIENFELDGDGTMWGDD